MPSFSYVGRSPEHIVGLPAGDLTAEEYDQLPYELQQAVLINKGSDGGPLYVEVHEAPSALVTVASPDDVTIGFPDPDPRPLDVPAEGGN